jgi:hypothetical protein
VLWLEGERKRLEDELRKMAAERDKLKEENIRLSV